MQGIVIHTTNDTKLASYVSVTAPFDTAVRPVHLVSTK